MHNTPTVLANIAKKIGPLGRVDHIKSLTLPGSIEVLSSHHSTAPFEILGLQKSLHRSHLQSKYPSTRNLNSWHLFSAANSLGKVNSKRNWKL